MLSSKLVKITILATLLLFIQIQTQNISGTNCFNTSTGQYQCNNQGYQGFSYNTSTNVNIYSVNCIGGGNCWYQVNSSNPNINQYVFCNYTFPGCSSCSNSSSCSNCYNGYYLYTYEVLLSYSNCQSCSQAIPGCQICQNQAGCSQCSLPYLNYDGQCFTQSGDPVSGFDPFSSGGSTAAQIVMNVFIFLILVAVAYAFFYLFVCKKNVHNNSNNSSSNYNLKQQAKTVSYNAAQRNSEMREPHEMRNDSMNRDIVKEPMSTRNGQQQHPAESSLRDELIVVDQTQRGMSNV